MDSSNGQSLTDIIMLLDVLNCGAALIDRAGTLFHVNTRLCEMIRQSCADLRGVSILDLYPDIRDRTLLHEMLEHFDERREAEFFLPLPDGEKLPIVVSSRPMPAPMS